MQDETSATPKPRREADRGREVNVDLIAVVVAVTDGQPRVLTIGAAKCLAFRSV